jgi:putative membrane protein
MMVAQEFTLRLGPTPTPTEDMPLCSADRALLERAAREDLREIALSEAIMPRLTRRDVKFFAVRVASDNAAANTEIYAIAKKKGVEFAAMDETEVDGDWLRSREDIDLRYVREMIAEELDAIALYEQVSRSENPEVAAFAAKTLAGLQRHMVMAHHLRKEIE